MAINGVIISSAVYLLALLVVRPFFDMGCNFLVVFGEILNIFYFVVILTMNEGKE